MTIAEEKTRGHGAKQSSAPATLLLAHGTGGRYGRCSSRTNPQPSNSQIQLQVQVRLIPPDSQQRKPILTYHMKWRIMLGYQLEREPVV